MSWWHKTWQPSGFSRIRAKQKLLRKHKGACKSSSSRIGNLKSFLLTIPWNLAKPVKISPGIIARLHHIDQTQMGLLREQCAEWKKAPLPYCCKSSLYEKWWADSMECFPFLRKIQDLLSDGKTPCERRFGQPFKGPIIPFGSLVEYYPIPAKDHSKIHQFGKKVLPGLFLAYALYGRRGNLEGWRTGCRPWGVGDDGRIGNLLKKVLSEESESRNSRGGTRFGNSVETIIPVQIKILPGDPEEPNEVRGADEEANSHLHWQFLGIWQVLRGIILDHCTSTPRSERRDICGAIAVRSG